MFNLQGSEIIVILLVALVVLGPEKLPEAVRRASRTYHELKKMGTGFQSELKAAIDEPMREMRETADLVRDAADPRKFAEVESRPSGEPRSTPSSTVEGEPTGSVEPAAGDPVMGEMWEDDPALDPGSTTVGTPPTRAPDTFGDEPRDDPDADADDGGALDDDDPDADADDGGALDDDADDADADDGGALDDDADDADADDGAADGPRPDTNDRPAL